MYNFGFIVGNIIPKSVKFIHSATKILTSYVCVKFAHVRSPCERQVPKSQATLGNRNTKTASDTAGNADSDLDAMTETRTLNHEPGDL